jgi:uncharacterized SAM-binding protein YcdF (DUF218 family)
MHTDDLARTLWDFLTVDHALMDCDAIIVFCSHDLRVADFASRLYHDGYAETIIFSGGIAHTDDLLETGWDEPEAVVFKTRALDNDVPERAIIMEEFATNTGENVRFTKQLVEGRFDSYLLVQKPFHERRVWATFTKHWPEADAVVASPPFTFDTYPDDQISKELVINLLVGEVLRNKHYPAKGYQEVVEIPDDVLDATEELLDRGFDAHVPSV